MKPTYPMPDRPTLKALCADFTEGWSHFLTRIDFDTSYLDAQAIAFMNEIPLKIAALARDL